jgi:polysaccharide biosynthesis protein VpsQ
MRFHPVKLALIVHAVLLTWLIVLADTRRCRQLFAVVDRIPAGDKIGHFVLFGTLSYLLNRVFRRAAFRAGWIRVPMGSVIVTVMVTIEEFSQRFLPARRFEWLDLAASILGVWILGFAAGCGARWRRAKPGAPSPDAGNLLT